MKKNAGEQVVPAPPTDELSEVTHAYQSGEQLDDRPASVLGGAQSALSSEGSGVGADINTVRAHICPRDPCAHPPVPQNCTAGYYAGALLNYGNYMELRHVTFIRCQQPLLGAFCSNAMPSYNLPVAESIMTDVCARAQPAPHTSG